MMDKKRELEEMHRIMGELASEIRNCKDVNSDFNRIFELGHTLRDRMVRIPDMDWEERYRALELMRQAKLLVLNERLAEAYLWRLETIEHDIRKVA